MRRKVLERLFGVECTSTSPQLTKELHIELVETPEPVVVCRVYRVSLLPSEKEYAMYCIDGEKHMVFDGAKWRNSPLDLVGYGNLQDYKSERYFSSYGSIYSAYEIAGHFSKVTITKQAEKVLDAWCDAKEVEKPYRMPKTDAERIVTKILMLEKAELDKLHEQKLEREERKKAAEQKELEGLPVEQLKKWVDTVLLPYHYLFYRTRSAAKADVYCSNCGEHSTFNRNEVRPVHGKIGVCPSCHAEAMFKSIGKSDTWNDLGMFHIITKTSTGIVVRRFYVGKQAFFDKEKKQAMHHMTLDERHRTWLHEREKLHDKRKSLIKTEWVGEMNVFSPKRNLLYTGNLQEALSGTAWERFDIETIWREYQIEKRASIENIFPHLSNRQVEALNSAKLYHLAQYACTGITNPVYAQSDDYRLDLKAIRLHDILKVNRQTLHQVQRLGNIDAGILRLLQFAESKHLVLKDEFVKVIQENEISSTLLIRLHNYTNSFTKALNYIKKINARSCININDIGRTWLDYLQMIHIEQQDVRSSTLYPRDLYAKHDELVELRNEQARRRKAEKDHEEALRRAETTRRIAEIEEKVNKLYGYRDANFIIRSAHDSVEIQLEGTTLHHCVFANQYDIKMSKEESFILFLRKKEEPDTPYYTLEVDPYGRLVQWYGINDARPDQKIIEPVIKRYKKIIQGRLWIPDKEARAC